MTKKDRFSQKYLTSGGILVLLFMFFLTSAIMFSQVSQKKDSAQKQKPFKLKKQLLIKDKWPDLEASLSVKVRKKTYPDGRTCRNFTPTFTVKNIGKAVALKFQVTFETKATWRDGWNVYYLKNFESLGIGKSKTWENMITERWCPGDKRQTGFRFKVDTKNTVREPSHENNNMKVFLYPSIKKRVGREVKIQKKSSKVIKNQ